MNEGLIGFVYTKVNKQPIRQIQMPRRSLIKQPIREFSVPSQYNGMARHHVEINGQVNFGAFVLDPEVECDGTRWCR